jgi:hypothetical protein
MAIIALSMAGTIHATMVKHHSDNFLYILTALCRILKNCQLGQAKNGDFPPQAPDGRTDSFSLQPSPNSWDGKGVGSPPNILVKVVTDLGNDRHHTSTTVHIIDSNSNSRGEEGRITHRPAVR